MGSEGFRAVVFGQNSVVVVGAETPYAAIVYGRDHRVGDVDLYVRERIDGDLREVRVSAGLRVTSQSGRNESGLVLAEACVTHPEWMKSSDDDFRLATLAIHGSYILQDDASVEAVIAGGSMHFELMKQFVDVCASSSVMLKRINTGNLDDETRRYMISRLESDDVLDYASELFRETFTGLVSYEDAERDGAIIVELINVMRAEQVDQFVQQMMSMKVKDRSCQIGILEVLTNRNIEHTWTLFQWAVSSSAREKHPWLLDTLRRIRDLLVGDWSDRLEALVADGVSIVVFRCMASSFRAGSPELSARFDRLLAKQVQGDEEH
ncbi:hypothetical protein HOI18_01535 [Candidatus Uhrbacteria bacterium]|jgi:hypothetical protein|nr:hypothetical protein [Candidatus Uhrbacteria bacterium]